MTRNAMRALCPVKLGMSLCLAGTLLGPVSHVAAAKDETEATEKKSKKEAKTDKVMATITEKTELRGELVVLLPPRGVLADLRGRYHQLVAGGIDAESDPTYLRLRDDAVFGCRLRALRLNDATPVLFIRVPDAGGPIERSAADALARLDQYAFAIFISPNAVDYSVPALLAHRTWPPGLIPAGVGQGTVKALAAHGINGCVAPTERFDSEALLALPALAAERVAGKRVAIFRGDGGRELLADSLRERGATVDCVPCYRRSGPSAGVAPLIAAWRVGRLDAITVSSSEGLRHLFDLLDSDGRTRTLADWRGRLVMVFFGFTQCPDVCPTALARAADVMQRLGPDAAKLQVIFVTIDPERDTPELLRAYTQVFHPSFLGLHADLDTTAATAQAFRVYYRKVPSGSSYTMDHTAISYVYDTGGRLRLAVRHEQSADEVAADLRRLLATG